MFKRLCYLDVFVSKKVSSHFWGGQPHVCLFQGFQSALADVLVHVVPCGCGSKLTRRGFAGVGPCFHLSGFQCVPFWYRFFDPQPYVVQRCHSARAQSAKGRGWPPVATAEDAEAEGREGELLAMENLKAHLKAHRSLRRLLS